jgi:hypothetical protein
MADQLGGLRIMSVVIRLMRAGAKKRPYYRMVATEKHGGGVLVKKHELDLKGHTTTLRGLTKRTIQIPAISGSVDPRKLTTIIEKIIHGSERATSNAGRLRRVIRHPQATIVGHSEHASDSKTQARGSNVGRLRRARTGVRKKTATKKK